MFVAVNTSASTTLLILKLFLAVCFFNCSPGRMREVPRATETSTKRPISIFRMAGQRLWQISGIIIGTKGGERPVPVSHFRIRISHELP